MSEGESSALEAVHNLIEVVCDGLGLDATIEVTLDNEIIYASLEGDDLGLFIGKHGATIDAVQHLAYKAAGHVETPSPRVIVDAAGYRKKRETALCRQADRAASDALKSGRAVAMDVMSAVDRKVVHEYLKTKPDIQTHSEGEEPNRHLIVSPAED